MILNDDYKQKIMEPLAETTTISAERISGINLNKSYTNTVNNKGKHTHTQDN